MMDCFIPHFIDLSKAPNYESVMKRHMWDVVLVADGKEIRAQKELLSARSPVFAAMFAHESTKEAQENRVEITDVNVEVVKLLVRYTYSGKVDILNFKFRQYALDLFVAADKYQMASLKSICKQELLSQITAGSVSDLLIFADKYQITELVIKCFDYIIDNGTQMFSSEDWRKSVTRTDLLAKLFVRLHLKYSKLLNDSDKKKVESKENKEDTPRPDFDFENFLMKYSNVIKSKEEMTDAVLVIGDTELNVHKKVLSVRSPVFAAMFADDSIKENRVEITDMDVDVLKLLIVYIYTANVEGLHRHVAFKLNCLKSTCEKQLLSQVVTIESVVNLFILADKHQATQMITKCVDYITDNGTEVMQQEDWKKIVLRADLVTKLVECLSQKYNQEYKKDLEHKRSVRRIQRRLARRHARYHDKISYRYGIHPDNVDDYAFYSEFMSELDSDSDSDCEANVFVYNSDY